MEMHEKVTLTTICGGVAQERFDYELQRVFENIKDPNYEAEAVREIVLTVKIKPDENRETIHSELTVKPKFPPMEKVSSMAILGWDIHGKIEATEIKPPRQQQLPINVTHIKKEIQQ